MFIFHDIFIFFYSFIYSSTWYFEFKGTRRPVGHYCARFTRPVGIYGTTASR